MSIDPEFKMIKYHRQSALCDLPSFGLSAKRCASIKMKGKKIDETLACQGEATIG